ncbi:MAG: YggS family pyridoxal phosphate-dependent enzyme [Terriglobales bacterium]
MAAHPIPEAIAAAREVIAGACARSGRAAGEVTLLAVSKTVAPEEIRAAYACGLRHFGENRVQERAAKQAALADLAIEWHLLGPLQSNKAARALDLFDCIETVDSLALAERLSRLTPRPLRVLMEINIASEPQKHGVAPAQALELAQAVSALPQVRLSGVMGVPPAAADPENTRPYFRALAELSGRIRAALTPAPGRWDLSMGMSHDYRVAIEEGATMVRLGTALFGARPSFSP